MNVVIDDKKNTGDWHDAIPYFMGGALIAGYFNYSIFKSMSPYGGTLYTNCSGPPYPLRELYSLLQEALQTHQTLPHPPHRRTRLFTQMFFWDVHIGTWDHQEK